MKVTLSPKAEKELKKISKINQIAIAKKIRSIRDTQIIANEEKLAGFPNIYRVRVGKYRIVYKRTVLEIYIIVILHRKDVYRLLWQLFK